MQSAVTAGRPAGKDAPLDRGLHLVFPQPERPKITVIIVAWRSAPHLIQCLEALHGADDSFPYEVVVAVNQPTDDLVNQIELHTEGLTVLRSAANLGFAAACNQAVAEGSGELIFLLNDDVILSPDCLHVLVETIERNSKAAAVGCQYLYPDGRLQEAGSVLWSDGNVYQLSYLVGPPADLVNQQRRSDYCSAAALMIRRSIWDEVGGLDEGYWPAYCEDVDLCLKFASLGQIVLYEPRAVVQHIMGSSASLRYRQFLVQRNRARLVQRWPELLAQQDPWPEPFTREAVFQAVARTADRPASGDRAALPADVRFKKRSQTKFLADELSLVRDFASGLEQMIDASEHQVQELTERVCSLEEARHSLEEAVQTRDQYLAAAHQQIEELARARDEVRLELEQVLNRRSLRLAESFAASIRRIPGAEGTTRRMAHLLLR